MSAPRIEDTPGRYKSPGPHVVTPELAARGNELLADAESARVQALGLDGQIEDLAGLRDRLWERSKAKRQEAARVLLGSDRLY